jgi:diadenosine tetraphosphate (Ap4A) HIT family hydrolase
MDADCPFCTAPSDRVWIDADLAWATHDMYPAAEGHSLVLPRRHVASIFDLSSEEREAVWQLVAVVRERLRRRYGPDSFTVGINDGVAAGQTILHAHVHIIPRHLGDVPDPTGGLRGILPHKARYWET